MEQRLQKIMAQAGLGSRRVCETVITEGRVKVNGKIATLGSKADPETDHIVVDGAELAKPAALVYIALHKPRGVLSTVEAPDPRTTVRDLVQIPGTIYPVGRLDVESEGLILLTNDGELANQLTHPSFGHEKEYRVLVSRVPDEAQLSAWRFGVILEDEYKTAPAEVEIETIAGKGAWLKVILREGRKRQIREMGLRTGLPVVRIMRIRIGTLHLGRLKPTEWRHLTAKEISELKRRPVKKTRRPAANRKLVSNANTTDSHAKPVGVRRSPARPSSRPVREQRSGPPRSHRTPSRRRSKP